MRARNALELTNKRLEEIQTEAYLKILDRLKEKIKERAEEEEATASVEVYYATNQHNGSKVDLSELIKRLTSKIEEYGYEVSVEYHPSDHENQIGHLKVNWGE